MPFRRLMSVLAGTGIAVTAAGCTGHVLPLGPYAAPQPQQLRSPFVLQAVLGQTPTSSGACVAGSVVLSGQGGSGCYLKVGMPVTISSAAVSRVVLAPATSPAGQPSPPPTYQFVITLPTAEVPALTAVTTTAADAHANLSISVAGRTWLLPVPVQPFTDSRFAIPLQSENQAVQLQQILAQSS
jgi:hypothetical protein